MKMQELRTTWIEMVLATGMVIGKQGKRSNEVPLSVWNLTVALKTYLAYTAQGGY